LGGGRIVGGAARGIDVLAFKAGRWYRIVALFFFIVALPGGVVFFYSTPSLGEIAWQLPWLVLVLAVSGSLLVFPYLAVLEGAGRLIEVYTVRLLQAVCGSLFCWILLICGAGLWSVIAIPVVAALIGFGWLLCNHKPLLRAPNIGLEQVLWFRDVWPLQWRVGIGMLCAYAQSQIYILVMLKTQGAVVAGRIGLSLSIVNMIVLLAQPWLVRKVPALTQAASNRDGKLMDRLFYRNLTVTLSLFLIGAFVVCTMLLLIPESILATRLLPLGEFAGLIAAMFANLIFGSLALYLRSFRREPYLALTIFSTVISLPMGVWAATEYSSQGLVMVLFVSNLCISLPYALCSWRLMRNHWLKMPERG